MGSTACVREEPGKVLTCMDGRAMQTWLLALRVQVPFLGKSTRHSSVWGNTGLCRGRRMPARLEPVSCRTLPVTPVRSSCAGCLASSCQRFCPCLPVTSRHAVMLWAAWEAARRCHWAAIARAADKKPGSMGTDMQSCNVMNDMGSGQEADMEIEGQQCQLL